MVERSYPFFFMELHNMTRRFPPWIACRGLTRQVEDWSPGPMTCRFSPWMVLLDPWRVVFHHERARSPFWCGAFCGTQIFTDFLSADYPSWIPHKGGHQKRHSTGQAQINSGFKQIVCVQGLSDKRLQESHFQVPCETLQLHQLLRMFFLSLSPYLFIGVISTESAETFFIDLICSQENLS